MSHSAKSSKINACPWFNKMCQIKLNNLLVLIFNITAVRQEFLMAICLLSLWANWNCQRNVTVSVHNYFFKSLSEIWIAVDSLCNVM